MDTQLLLSALRARYRILLAILGITVLVTAAVSMLIPKTYVATVAMMVDSKDIQSINVSNQRSTSARDTTGFMQTQIDIINSPKVARKVIRELGLANRPDLRLAFMEETGGEGTIEDWLIDQVLLRMKVDTSQSSVIRIAYSSNDPAVSAAVANAFAKAYMDTALELRVEPSRQTAAWFDDQIKALRDTVDKAQARLTEFQKEKGIVGIDERFDVETMALSNMAAQAARSGPLSDSLGIVTINPVAQTLRTELLRSEARLAELGTRLGSDHPQYQRQLAETRKFREQLNTEIGNTPNLLGNNARRSSELRGSIAALQSRVLDLRHYRNQVGVLIREADIAERAYETAMQRAVAIKVDSRANLTNISVLNPAIPPFKAARPRIALNLALALVVGTLLGLTVIYLMEMFDRRVRSIADLEYVQVPYLGEFNAWQPQPARLLGRPSLQALPGPG